MCGAIEYATAGSGPPVLLVHGAGGGFDQGLMLGAPLTARGFRVIAAACFGYLRTPLPGSGWAATQADAHGCLLDALGIERAAVVGISAGAPSAPELAVRHAQCVGALVLLVPAACVPPGTRQLFETALRSDFLFWALRRTAPTLLCRGVLGTPPKLVARASPEARARVPALLDAILPLSKRRLGLLNYARVTKQPGRPAFEKITAATLAIGVADDFYGTYDSARYTAEQIPGAPFVGSPEGGHVLVGIAAEVTAAIREFPGAAAWRLATERWPGSLV